LKEIDGQIIPVIIEENCTGCISALCFVRLKNALQ